MARQVEGHDPARVHRQMADTLDAVGLATYTKHDSPQIQAGVSYAFGDPKSDSFTGKVWADLVSQKVQASPADQAGNVEGASKSFTGSAFDAGVKFAAGGFEGVLYGYSGSGIGTTGLFILPSSDLGRKRDSDGGYAQLSYKFDRVKLGISYGESRLKLTSDEKALGASNSDLLKRNQSGVGGIYFSLTKSITLVGEYVDTKAKAFNGNSADESTYILGGIIFF